MSALLATYLLLILLVVCVIAILEDNDSGPFA
jgi:hypothetical protein